VFLLLLLLLLLMVLLLLQLCFAGCLKNIGK
jgi:hypothetical protein